MVNDAPRIVSRFPQPPGQIRQALVNLAIVRGGDAEAIAELGDTRDLPRPWDPATCPADLRQQLWLWCDDVVAWINHQYSWRTASLIPGCWPRHPHIAHELPVLACLRDSAESTGPELLEEWHRHTLPLFTDRLTARLGESTCRVGKHQDWPAAARYHAANDPQAVTERQNVFHTDTHPRVQPAAHRQREPVVPARSFGHMGSRVGSGIKACHRRSTDRSTAPRRTGSGTRRREQDAPRGASGDRGAAQSSSSSAAAGAAGQPP